MTATARRSWVMIKGRDFWVGREHFITVIRSQSDGHLHAKKVDKREYRVSDASLPCAQMYVY